MRFPPLPACLVSAMTLAGTVCADSANITIYSGGSGVVSETRTIEFAKGRQIVSFDGVSQHIDPSSVLLDGQGLNLLEQNYVYDLVNGSALLSRFLEKEITVYLSGSGELVTGKLLSFTNDLVLQNDSGITSLTRSALQAVKFPELPEGLRSRPALDWLIDAEKAGSQEVTTTYTSGGLGWQAEYVCLLNEDDTAMEMAAWVNLHNTTGISWKDAGLQLVAGELNRIRPSKRPMSDLSAQSSYKVDDEGVFREENLFEYHLYTLPRRVDLENKQDKEIALFDAVHTRITKEFVFDSRQIDGVYTKLRFANRKGEGPGVAIPQGKLRLYKRDSGGRKQFIGEDRVEHTPVNEDIDLTVGKAFDLVVERLVLSHSKQGNGYETGIQFNVRNRKEKEAVTIFLDEYRKGDWEVVECSHTCVRRDANRARITVSIAAGQEQAVTLTLRGKN